jgi:four helix bundle protein
MARIKSLKDLDVWQISMQVTQEIYALTNELPKSELFGLTSQLRRAALSIPSNIAEGSKRSTRADFRHFCLIALGSAAELETQLLLLERIYPNIAVNQTLIQVVDVQKMLTSLACKLQVPKQ